MKEKRQHKRFMVEGMEIHARTASCVEVNLVDMSMGGVSVQTPKRLNIGGKYSLKLGDGDDAITLPTEVIWEKLSGSTKNGKGETVPLYTAGLQYRDTVPPGIGKLREYLEELGTVTENRLSGVRFKIKSPETATLRVPSTFAVKKLSAGGMLIETDCSPEMGEALEIELVLPGTDAHLNIRGHVTSSVPVSSDGAELYDIGVRFSEISDGDGKRLEDLITELQELD